RGIEHLGCIAGEDDWDGRFSPDHFLWFIVFIA
ncbi:hypothetical protein PSYJA_41812, partial [Pseudomonas syringae pv. japonica str. M301072]